MTNTARSLGGEVECIQKRKNKCGFNPNSGNSCFLSSFLWLDLEGQIVIHMSFPLCMALSPSQKAACFNLHPKYQNMDHQTCSGKHMHTGTHIQDFSENRGGKL